MLLVQRCARPLSLLLCSVEHSLGDSIDLLNCADQGLEFKRRMQMDTGILYAEQLDCNPAASGLCQGSGCEVCDE
jgi:hypothetical protein